MRTFKGLLLVLVSMAAGAYCHHACLFHQGHGNAVSRAALTRLELVPAELRIPVGEDRDVHVEVFSYDTPVVPIHVKTWISSGADVAELRSYHAPFIAVRGLQVGTAELAVAIGEELKGSVPITVTGAERE